MRITGSRRCCMPGGLGTWSRRFSQPERTRSVHQRARALRLVLCALAGFASLFLTAEIAYSQVDPQVSIVSGNNQTGLVNTVLPNPLVVEVLDPSGLPFPGISIQWQVTGGGGSLSTTSGITDANGRASTTLTLGPNPGSNTVTATASDIDLGIIGTVTFSATAQPQPATLQIVSGNNQSGQVSTALPNPFVVQVLSDTQQPVAGAIIQWQVQQGGGNLSTTSSTTDANGRASTTLTLGPSPGTNSVIATGTVFGASLGPVTFSATAQPQPAMIQIVSGNNQTAQVSTALPNPFVVQVLSGTQPVAGATIQWQVQQGGGNLSTTSSTTDANGQASTTLTLGPNAGANSVIATATVNGASIGSVTFSATAQPQPATLQIVSGNNQNGQVSTALPNPFVVQVLSGTQPVAGATIQWQVQQGGGSLSTTSSTTDANGQASTTLTLGASPGTNTVIVTATVNGTNIGSVTFSATGAQVTPTAGSLQKVSGDNQKLVPGTSGDLVVRAVGTNGQPLPGVQVSWSVSPASAGQLAQATTTTGPDGQARNTITVGAPQSLQVIASALGQSTTFNLNTGLTFGPGLNEAQRAIARTIDIVCPSGVLPPESDLQQRCTELIVNQSTSPGAVANALQQVAPEEVASQGKSTVEVSTIQFANLGARLAALRSGAVGLSLGKLAFNVNGKTLSGATLAALTPRGLRGGAASADEGGAPGRLGVFVNGNINFGDKDATGRESGFDFNTKGITAGVDYRFSDRAILGVAAGYASSSVDLDSSGGKMDHDGYSVSVYGTYYHSERLYIEAMAGYGWNSFDASRGIVYRIPNENRTSITTVNQTATAENDGQQYSFSLGAGYDMHRGPLTFGPVARVNYIKATIDGFTERSSKPGESGAGWRLAVDDQDVDSLTTFLGAQASYAISQRWGVLLPQARAEWVHEFMNDSRLITGHFVEDPSRTQFALPTDEPDRNYFNLGVGVSAVLQKGRSAFINFETSLGNERLNTHSVTAGVRLEF